jgi:hypothetical protein
LCRSALLSKLSSPVELVISITGTSVCVQTLIYPAYKRYIRWYIRIYKRYIRCEIKISSAATATRVAAAAAATVVAVAAAVVAGAATTVTAGAAVTATATVTATRVAAAVVAVEGNIS